MTDQPGIVWKQEVASGKTRLGFDAWMLTQPSSVNHVLADLQDQLGRERDMRIAAQKDAEQVRLAYADALQRRAVEAKHANTLIADLKHSNAVLVSNWDTAQADAKQALASIQASVKARESVLIETVQQETRNQMRLEHRLSTQTKERRTTMKKCATKPMKKATKKAGKKLPSGFKPYGKK